MDRQTGIESIRALSWRELEQLLAEAFKRKGYVVHETGPGADGGIEAGADHQWEASLVVWEACGRSAAGTGEVVGEE